jgi:hypothetical protein
MHLPEFENIFAKKEAQNIHCFGGFCNSPRGNIPYPKFVFVLQCKWGQGRILEQQSSAGHGVHTRPIVPLPHGTESTSTSVSKLRNGPTSTLQLVHSPARHVNSTVFLSYTLYYIILYYINYIIFCYVTLCYGTASVVKWSEFLAADAEIPGSILGATRFSK